MFLISCHSVFLPISPMPLPPTLHVVVRKVLILLHKKEFKGKTNGWRAWGSSDQILILFRKIEFKGKVNSNQESAKLLKWKYTFNGGSAGLLERQRWVGLWTFLFSLEAEPGKMWCQCSLVSSQQARSSVSPFFFLHWCFWNCHGVAGMMGASVFAMWMIL